MIANSLCSKNIFTFIGYVIRFVLLFTKDFLNTYLRKIIILNTADTCLTLNGTTISVSIPILL